MVFTFRAKSGATVSRSGITRNVSPGGIYFRTTSVQDLYLHQEVTVSLVVSRRGAPSEATVSLSGEARILRTERLQPQPGPDTIEGEWWGVAAQFTCRPRVDLSSVDYLFGGV